MVRKDRRPRRPLADQWELPASPENMLARGRAHFDRGDYTAAIRAWESIRDQQATRGREAQFLRNGLAEAYFRRGITNLPVSTADLQTAVDLAPEEPRYRYQLGRVFFRRGDWRTAAEWYLPLVLGPEVYAKAVVPLAAALVAGGTDIGRHPLWLLLSTADQGWLRQVAALITSNSARALDHRGAELAGGRGYWSGLAGTVMGRPDAVAVLEGQIEKGNLPTLCAAVGQYFLGVNAWRQGDAQRAATSWKAAMDMGLHTSWVRQNTFVACQRLSLDIMNLVAQRNGVEAVGVQQHIPDQRLEQALRWADLGLLIVPDDRHLLAVKRQVHFRLGYSAAVGGDWENASRCWRAAKEAGDDSRPLLINLAIASEKLGQHALAADCWGQVVRRRPRRADARNAWDYELVARMWRHVAENYRKAGDYEAATRTYRNAVKWAPDDMGLKLDLAESLMADGRSRAAATVVDDVLGADADNVEALAWRAAIREEEGFYVEAQKLWRRVLTLDPGHLRSRMHVAGLYEADGDTLRRAGHVDLALDAYREGLKYMPENPRLHTSIAICFAERNDGANCRRYLKLALEKAANPTEAYYWVIRAQLYLGNWNEMRALMMESEALTPPPTGRFYLDMGEYAAYLGRTEWVEFFLEKAQRLEPDNVHLLVDIAVVLGENGQKRKAVTYLRRAVRTDPRSAIAHMWLGNYYYSYMKEPELAETHWVRAEDLARETKNLPILFQMRMVRGFSQNRPGMDLLDDDYPPEAASSNEDE